jgi:PAS domain S-box-containing protein
MSRAGSERVEGGGGRQTTDTKSGAGSPRRERILLVDDEPQVLVALEDLLSDRFSILKAESGQEALELLEREDEIAVVVTDHRMPSMTGAELLARLGEGAPALRILLTGFADIEAVTRAVNDGRIFAYLSKPWNPDDLRLKVERAAEQFRLATELSREQQRLEEQTTILNAVLESVGEGVIVAEKAGGFLLFNHEAERLLGTGADAVSVSTWQTSCGLKPSGEADNPIALGMTDRVEAEFEIDNQSVRGVTVAVTATPLRTKSDVLLGSVALLRDVTERRLLARRLLESEKLESIGRLAGSVAHDFNNLLAVIQGYGDLILERMATEDPARDDLDRLLVATERATALTKQLLAIGRTQGVERETFDLNAVVHAMLRLIRPILGDRITVETTMPRSALPARANVLQVEQILLNLTTNARDAMPEGGTLFIETLETVVEASDVAASVPPGEFVVLSVADTGIGMTPDTQKRMFEPFFTTKEPGKGTGIGLSTVFTLVQQNLGHVRVESAVGRGSRFQIYLPRGEGFSENLGDLTATENDAARPVTAAKILLVDEDDAVRRVAARILGEHGHIVVAARNADEARKVFQNDGVMVDLLVTDVTVPAPGPELASELAAAHPGLRILYMSGYWTGSLSQPPVASVGYLAKPFTRRALIGEVDRLLQLPPAEARDPGRS